MLPEAATRAGWTLDHANSVYEAVFNLSYIVGPGIGGLLIATLGGINTMWVTASAFGLSIIAISVLRLEGTGRPDRESAARRCLGRHRRGAAVRLAQPGAAHAGVRGPRRNRSVHAHGERALPEIFHRPQRTRSTGLGAHGAEHRRSGRRTGLRGAVEVHEPTRDHAHRGPDTRRGDDRDRVSASVAADPCAVRRRRTRVRADRADLQLRHADPCAAAPARPRGRRDGVTGVRRGSARVGRGGPAGRRGRPACDLPCAVAADAGARRRRGVPACAATSWTARPAGPST